MSPSSTRSECDALEIATLTTLARNRPLRESSRSQVKVSSVPIRTCYEALMRVWGPRAAVLDFVELVGAAAAASAAPPQPPMAIEEAHTDDAGETLSLLLARGVYTNA